MKHSIGRAVPWLLAVAIIGIVSTQLWEPTTKIPTLQTPTPGIGLVASRSIAMYAVVQSEDVRMTIEGTPIAESAISATATIEAQATALSQTVIGHLALEDITINQPLIVGENLGPRTEDCDSLYILTVRVIPMTTGLQPGSKVSLIPIATAAAGTPAADSLHAVVMHIGETDSAGYVAVTLATDLAGGRHLAQQADAVFIASSAPGVSKCRIGD